MVRASRYDYAPYFSLTGNHHTHTQACDLTLGNHCAAVAAGFIYKTNLAGKSRQLSLIGAPRDAYADVHTMLAMCVVGCPCARQAVWLPCGMRHAVWLGVHHHFAKATAVKSWHIVGTIHSCMRTRQVLTGSCHRNATGRGACHR